MRVIAGRLGGRRLAAPRGASTRPTSDRVREALFSILGDVEGTRVLDLYAGTGALGIEALSRGAERAVFVESARGALAALRNNLRSLELEPGAQVIAAPAFRAVAEAARGGPFDLVLVDPPYGALDDAARVLARLAAAKDALSPGARLVLEHAARDEPPRPAGLVPESTRVYGSTALSFYRPAREAEPGPPLHGLAQGGPDL